MRSVIQHGLALGLLLTMAGCANQVQMERDKLRYAATTRGTETYEIKEKDSLDAAKERAAQAILDYEKHMNVYTDILDYGKDKAAVLDGQKKLLAEIADLKGRLAKKEEGEAKPKSKDKKERKAKPTPRGDVVGTAELLLRPKMVSPGSGTEPQGATSFKTTTEEAKRWLSNPELFWPGGINQVIAGSTTTTVVKNDGKKTETTTTVAPFGHANAEELIRGLSSTASMGQIRDLITEPEVPELLPTKRSISVGCLPPPDSAAFEAATTLTAKLEKAGSKLGISSEYADKVVKLFEESERTMFLQYALFRLCEMSVNTPSGFRNVFPVIMHDMVRRAAELRDVAVKEAETRRTEEEKTRQKELDLKGSRQKAYFDCLGSKKDKDGNLYTDETATACRRQVNIDLSRKE